MSELFIVLITLLLILGSGALLIYLCLLVIGFLFFVGRMGDYEDNDFEERL